MYSNFNAQPTMGMGMGANVPPNVSPMQTAPAFGYGHAEPACYQPYNFTVIVVLFILLVIIGASCFNQPDC